MSYTASTKAPQISDFVESLCMFYLPQGGKIYDPTSGLKNYQFKWNKNTKLTGINYEYLASDLQKTKQSEFLASVRSLPLQEKIVDLTWYDPPYLPQSTKMDKRQMDYGIGDMERLPLDVARFYDKDVMRELVRVTKKYLVVRGSDFYYPTTSANLYLFFDLIIKSLRQYCIIIALYTYKVQNPNFPLYRKVIKSTRPIITHNYTVVGLIQ